MLVKVASRVENAIVLMTVRCLVDKRLAKAVLISVTTIWERYQVLKHAPQVLEVATAMEMTFLDSVFALALAFRATTTLVHSRPQVINADLLTGVPMSVDLM